MHIIEINKINIYNNIGINTFENVTFGYNIYIFYR